MQPEPNQPEREQRAQFRAPFGGGHLAGMQRVGAFHGLWLRLKVSIQGKSQPPGCFGTLREQACYILFI